jgi:hypothetical protein
VVEPSLAYQSSGETSAGTLQTRETIGQPCSDVLAHTPEVCKGTHLYNGYPATKDDHDSWGTCTTSAECKTVITVVLMVLSGMDTHMISGTRAGLVESGLVSLVDLVDPPQWTLRCDQGLVWKLWSLLRYLESFGRV